MARPIIQISNETRELIMSVSFLRSCGCPVFNFSNLTLDVVRDGCGPDPSLHLETDGCSFWYVQETPQPIGVQYRVFEIDDGGNLVFYFDGAIKELPFGRYVGIIKANKTPLLEFALDIIPTQFELTSARTEGYKWKN